MRKKILAGVGIVAVVALALAVAVSSIGNLKRQDSLVFMREDAAPANTQRADYQVRIGKGVGGATVVAELWQNGACTQGSPVALGNQTERLHMTFLADGFGTDEGARGLNVQMDTDAASGSVLSHFELPTRIVGYSFAAYEDKEVIEVNAGEEKILAAMVFDTGEGVTSMDCASLLEEPERITSAPCLLIVRAAFTSEEIPPQASEPAQ